MSIFKRIKEAASAHARISRASAEPPQVATFAVAIESDEAPEWIELIPAGKFTAVDGRGPFINADPDAIVAASMARMPQVGLVLDYEHSTDLAAPRGRPAPAAGWIKQFKVDAGAIFARIEWTRAAAEAIKEKLWRYVSPVFEHSEENVVQRILRAAITNNPALTELPAIAAAQRQTMAEKRDGMSVEEMAKHFPAREGEPASAHAARLMKHIQAEEMSDDGGEDMSEVGSPEWKSEEEAEPQHQEPYDGEDETAEHMASRHAEEMAKCATDDDRAACLSRHSAEKEAMSKRMAARMNAAHMSIDPKALDAAVAKHPMVVRMAAEINQMRLADARKGAMAMVDQAIREGRLIPSQRDWAIEYCSGNAAGFQKFIGAAPKIIQQGADGTFTGRIGEPANDASTFSSKQIEIFAGLGIETPEQLAKCAAVQEKWTLQFPRPRLFLDDSNTGRKDDGGAQ